MSKKIDASKWNAGLEIKSIATWLQVDTPFVSHGKSEFGRSQAQTACGFCGQRETVFIWSFAGSGKKCSNCGAIIGWRSTSADKQKVIKIPDQYKHLIESP